LRDEAKLGIVAQQLGVDRADRVHGFVVELRSGPSRFDLQGVPVPVPISSTRCPGATSSASSMLSMSTGAVDEQVYMG